MTYRTAFYLTMAVGLLCNGFQAYQVHRMAAVVDRALNTADAALDARDEASAVLTRCVDIAQTLARFAR